MSEKDMSIEGQGYKLPLHLREEKYKYIISDSTLRLTIVIQKGLSEEYLRPRIQQMIDAVNEHDRLTAIADHYGKVVIALRELLDDYTEPGIDAMFKHGDCSKAKKIARKVNHYEKLLAAAKAIQEGDDENQG